MGHGSAVEKLEGVGEIETSLRQDFLALFLIPFEFHRDNVACVPTICNHTCSHTVSYPFYLSATHRARLRARRGRAFALRPQGDDRFRSSSPGLRQRGQFAADDCVGCRRAIARPDGWRGHGQDKAAARRRSGDHFGPAATRGEHRHVRAGDGQFRPGRSAPGQSPRRLAAHRRLSRGRLCRGRRRD